MRAYHKVSGIDPKGGKGNVDGLREAQEAFAVKLAGAGGEVDEVLGEDVHPSGEEDQVRHFYEDAPDLRVRFEFGFEFGFGPCLEYVWIWF